MPNSIPDKAWMHISADFITKLLLAQEYNSIFVMNRLDPIEELYDMYSEEEDTPRIVEIEDDGLDFVSDIEGLVDSHMNL